MAAQAQQYPKGSKVLVRIKVNAYEVKHSLQVGQLRTAITAYNGRLMRVHLTQTEREYFADTASITDTLNYSGACVDVLRLLAPPPASPEEEAK